MNRIPPLHPVSPPQRIPRAYLSGQTRPFVVNQYVGQAVGDPMPATGLDIVREIALGRPRTGTAWKLEGLTLQPGNVGSITPAGPQGNNVTAIISLNGQVIDDFTFTFAGTTPPDPPLAQAHVYQNPFTVFDTDDLILSVLTGLPNFPRAYSFIWRGQVSYA